MVFNFWVMGLSIGAIWLIIITIYLWKLYYHFKNLSNGVTNKNLIYYLENLIKKIQTLEKQVKILQEKYDTIELDGRLHVQKIGLLRFNPFKDTGGDQSFILSLLDANNTGVVISGLYSRSGTRWYAKRIKSGKSTEHELSDEEKKAVKEAQRI